MRHELTVRAGDRPPEAHRLSGATTAGGSRADGLFLPGAPPAAMRLVAVATGIVVHAGAAGIRVAGHAVTVGTARLLRPGERAELQGSTLALEAAARPGGATRVAAAALLREAACGAPAIAGPRLVVLTGPAAGEGWALGAEQTLGRGRRATFRVADPHASRVHARVRAGPEAVTIEDLRSKNGVRLNGVRVDRRPCPLRPGDEVAIGETLLAFEDVAPPCAREAGAGAQAPEPRPRLPPHALAAALLALSAVALALAGS